MSQSTVILEPSSQRQSLAGALSQAGLVDWDGEDAEERAYSDRADFIATTASAGSAQVQQGWISPGERTVTHSQSPARQASSWTPPGFTPQTLTLLDDPQRAAELPWLKAKRKGRFRRRAKMLTAWLATLLITGAVLAGTAYVMGLYPWLKGTADTVARQ